jgi:hypothetical protein
MNQKSGDNLAEDTKTTRDPGNKLEHKQSSSTILLKATLF